MHTRAPSSLLTSLGYDAGLPDGRHGKQTVTAIRAFQLAEGLKEDGMVTPELLSAVYAKAGKGTPPNGQILVRQKFKPVVEEPITRSAIPPSSPARASWNWR